MGYDRKFLLWALVFAVFGLCVGIFMAASKNHGLLVAHAHIMLIGFVVTLIYAIVHKLWLVEPVRWMAVTQYIVHVVSAIAVSIGLLLLYGNVYSEAQLDPLLIPGSLGVLVGMLLMTWMVLVSGAATRKTGMA